MERRRTAKERAKTDIPANKRKGFVGAAVLAAGLTMLPAAARGQERHDRVSEEPQNEGLYSQVQAKLHDHGPVHYITPTFDDVPVDPRAISLFKGSSGARFGLEDNKRRFSAFSDGERDSFEPSMLYAGLDMGYEYLESRSASGIHGGHAISFTPLIGLGLGIDRQPMELVTHATFGYRNVVGYEDIYLSRYGFELRTPATGKDKPILWFEKAGVGMVGPPTNPFVYGTTSLTYKESDTIRVQSVMTPEYSYIEERHRAGAEFTPLDFTIGLDPRFSWQIGPASRFEYTFSDHIPTVSAFMKTAMELHGIFMVDLQFGYITDLGGDIEAGASRVNNFFGGINITTSIYELLSIRERAREPPQKVAEKATEPSGGLGLILSH